MKLKLDKLLRDRWFVPGAMSHPAKGHLGLWWELFERYTKPGQWVLDPMAGIGSSMIGAMMGRNVICNEMEPHFITPMKASWAKMRQQAMLGCEMGQVVIIRGDARCLPLGRADCVVTSPPYEGAVDDKRSPEERVKRGRTNPKAGGGFGPSLRSPGYTRPAAVVTSPPWEDVQPFQDKQFVPPHDKNGFGSQSGYTRPAAVVTSPPYSGDGLGHDGAEGPNAGSKEKDARRFNGSYTHPVDAVVTSPPYPHMLPSENNKWLLDHQGQIPHYSGKPDYVQKVDRHLERSQGWTHPVDAVVTSPPYENSELPRQEHDLTREDGVHERYRYAARDATNIGNLRGKAYWEAMRLVYQECFRVLVPGGVMVLVVKGYTRDGQYVDLPQQTVDECEALGFRLRERWARELWNLSFWRILQKRRNPAAFDDRLRFEDVLVLDTG